MDNIIDNSSNFCHLINYRILFTWHRKIILLFSYASEDLGGLQLKGGVKIWFWHSTYVIKETRICNGLHQNVSIYQQI